MFKYFDVVLQLIARFYLFLSIFIIYDNRNLEEVTSYKYLRIDIHHKVNWNYIIEKRINGGWKTY